MQETSTTDGEKCPLKRSRSKQGRAAVHDFEEELYSPVKKWKRTSGIQSSSVHPSDSSSQSYDPIHQESHMESDPMDPSDLIAVKSEPTDSSYIIYIDNAEEPSEMTEMVALSQENSGIDVPEDTDKISDPVTEIENSAFTQSLQTHKTSDTCNTQLENFPSEK